jgi:hypothetical protein
MYNSSTMRWRPHCYSFYTSLKKTHIHIRCTYFIFYFVVTVVKDTKEKNAREYRRGNQKWTIQKNWQHYN